MQQSAQTGFSGDPGKLKHSIILTLGYSGQFLQVLSVRELWLRLVGRSKRSSQSSQSRQLCLKLHQRSRLMPNPESNPAAFVRELLALVNQGLVQLTFVNRRPYFGLTDIPEPLTTGDLPESILREIAEFRFFARILPWVKAIAVTGSVAAGVIKSNDDLDFLLITQRHRLWLVRPLVVMYSQVRGKRRTWRREEPQSWCFNLWLEENSLAMPPQRRSIYTAYEVCQTKFVFGSNTHLQFLAANQWAKSQLPHFFAWNVQSSSLADTSWEITAWRRFAGLVDWLLSPVLSLLNLLAFRLQLLYMRPHRTTERVWYSGAFFHPRNTQRVLYDGWRATLSQWAHGTTRTVKGKKNHLRK